MECSRDPRTKKIHSRYYSHSSRSLSFFFPFCIPSSKTTLGVLWGCLPSRDSSTKTNQMALAIPNLLRTNINLEFAENSHDSYFKPAARVLLGGQEASAKRPRSSLLGHDFSAPFVTNEAIDQSATNTRAQLSFDASLYVSHRARNYTIQHSCWRSVTRVLSNRHAGYPDMRHR